MSSASESTDVACEIREERDRASPPDDSAASDGIVFGTDCGGVIITSTDRSSDTSFFADNFLATPAMPVCALVGFFCSLSSYLSVFRPAPDLSLNSLVYTCVYTGFVRAA